MIRCYRLVTEGGGTPVAHRCGLIDPNYSIRQSCVVPIGRGVVLCNSVHQFCSIVSVNPARGICPLQGWGTPIDESSPGKVYARVPRVCYSIMRISRHMRDPRW